MPNTRPDEDSLLLNDVTGLAMLFAGDTIYAPAGESGGAAPAGSQENTTALPEAPAPEAKPAADEGATIRKPERPLPRLELTGKNLKNLVLVVNDATNEVGSMEGRLLLGKILKAMGYTRDDAGFINLAPYMPLGMGELRHSFAGSRFIFFGITANEIGLESEAEEAALFTLGLDLLNSDTAAKKDLWAKLKRF